jgi:hypothetical protein
MRQEHGRILRPQPERLQHLFPWEQKTVKVNGRQRVTTHLRLAEESLPGILLRDSLRALTRVFRTPVSNETRQLLQITWARLPERLRTPRQFLGRQYAGCGAPALFLYHKCGIGDTPGPRPLCHCGDRGV